MGEDVLVGGDDRLARRERGRDERPGGLVAAHQLDDHVDVGVGHEVGRCVGQEIGGDAGRRGPAQVSDRDAGEAEGDPVRPMRSSSTRSSSARTTSRPTVPAPRTATRRGAVIAGRAGRRALIAREW